MKKKILTLFIAIVAIGGAYADSFVFNLGGPAEEYFNCQGSGSSCAQFAIYPYGSITDVTNPSDPVVVEDHSIFLFLMRTAE